MSVVRAAIDVREATRNTVAMPVRITSGSRRRSVATDAQELGIVTVRWVEPTEQRAVRSVISTKTTLAKARDWRREARTVRHVAHVRCAMPAQNVATTAMQRLVR